MRTGKRIFLIFILVLNERIDLKALLHNIILRCILGLIYLPCLIHR